MSEKTAEEKLRQALEGSTTNTKEQESSQVQKKPKPSRARSKAEQTRAVKSGDLDSFMDDFERRIEQSVSTVKSSSESQEKPSRVKISAEPKSQTLRRVRTKPKANPEPLQEFIPSQP